MKRVLAAAALAVALGAAGAASAQQQGYLGEVRAFAFNFCPQGWLKADGAKVPIQQATPLYSLIGAVYGGDGRTFFMLPDLRSQTPIGGPPGSTLGAPTNGPPRFLTMTWCIAVTGQYPPRR